MHRPPPLPKKKIKSSISRTLPVYKDLPTHSKALVQKEPKMDDLERWFAGMTFSAKNIHESA